jgi:hemolysin activation/secretion protein
MTSASSAPAQNRAQNQDQIQNQNQTQNQERQERPERPDDWATDNLDMVSASPFQIRQVLLRDPGLMVELKRLMAKQATERGQIVSERDLEDAAVMDRLETDTRFRALATRLLQRYGYLSPQLNPESPAGKEQDLQLKAQAERLVRLANAPTNETGL